MSEGEKRSATKRKRSKKQGVGGKPTIVKSPMDIAFQLLKEFYIDDNNPDTEGFYSPPENAHEALAELPRNQRMDNFRNYGGDISDLQDKGKYSRGGSQPRLQPSGAFVGARVGIDTDDSDESIQSLGDTLGHEYVHSLIEPEVNEWSEQKHGPLQSQVKPLYQQVQFHSEPQSKHCRSAPTSSSKKPMLFLLQIGQCPLSCAFLFFVIFILITSISSSNLFKRSRLKR